MIVQFGTTPYRLDAKGRLSVLLITSRETHRWVIPRGNPISGLSPRASAAQETFEEAGVKGQVEKKPIGTYDYDKRKDGTSVPTRVEVFPLAVKVESSKWPEQSERKRHWFDPEEAAKAVEEPGLASLILAFAAKNAPA